MPNQAEIVEAVARQLQNKNLSQQAVMVLQKATARVLERIKQNVDAQVREDSSPIVEEFTRNVASKMSAMTQQWGDGIKNDLVVFPEGTRYIWRDGGFTTIIVEQQPQLRNINIVTKSRGEKPAYYYLAMPYVQFILTFKEHVPQGTLTVGCTKKSITDIDQPMYHLPLPNVDEQHKVCMGDYVWPKSGNMTDMVNSIVGSFWQSQFNEAHVVHYNKFCADNNLTVKDWERASKADPLFTVAKTTKLVPGHTFRHFLATDQNDKTGVSSIVTKLKQEIIKAVGEIGGDIQNLLTSVDLKTENREKAHVETLQVVLKEIIVQAYSELWEYLQKQLADERAKMQREMQVAANKLKDDFVSYMDQKKKVW